jgi:hypothetical protein
MVEIKKWTVKEEWKEEFLWVVTVKDGTEYTSRNFCSEKVADKYIDEIKSGKHFIFLAKNKITI